MSLRESIFGRPSHGPASAVQQASRRIVNMVSTSVTVEMSSLARVTQTALAADSNAVRAVDGGRASKDSRVANRMAPVAILAGPGLWECQLGGLLHSPRSSTSVAADSEHIQTPKEHLLVRLLARPAQ